MEEVGERKLVSLNWSPISVGKVVSTVKFSYSLSLVSLRERFFFTGGWRVVLCNVLRDTLQDTSYPKFNDGSGLLEVGSPSTK